MSEITFVLPTWLTWLLAVWVILYFVEAALKLANLCLEWYIGYLVAKGRKK